MKKSNMLNWIIGIGGAYLLLNGGVKGANAQEIGGVDSLASENPINPASDEPLNIAKEVKANAQAINSNTPASIVQSANIRQAADRFANAPINTPASIQAGIDIINLGGAVRTSSIIAKVGENAHIANLGSTTALVTVQPAKRNSAGLTNFDLIIAKNKAKQATLK